MCASRASEPTFSGRAAPFALPVPERRRTCAGKCLLDFRETNLKKKKKEKKGKQKGKRKFKEGN